MKYEGDFQAASRDDKSHIVGQAKQVKFLKFWTDREGDALTPTVAVLVQRLYSLTAGGWNAGGGGGSRTVL